ncbi:MAG: ribonuclease catalytic domain-containing protein [Candidatus Rifleibacteriota bacterium]
MNLVAGCVVEYVIKGNKIGLAAVLNAAEGNVRLFLANGKETSVTEKKILHATKKLQVNLKERETGKNQLQEIDARRNKLVKQLNLEELYELLAEEERSLDLAEIAGFLFDEDEEDETAALLRALVDDKLYFRYKNDLFTAVSRDELEQSLQKLAKEEAQEQQIQTWVQALKDSRQNKQLAQELKPELSQLKNFVAWGAESEINKKLFTALDRAGLANQRKLKAFLVGCNEMDIDENLLLLKYRVPVDFSEEIHDVVSELIDKFNNELSSQKNRIDLRNLKAWAIDTPGSKDRDDAFSFETEDDGSVNLYVHIADPAEFILPETPLDREAARRGSSIYMPDSRIHMLPAQLSEDCLSLSANGDRLALSIILKFSPQLELSEVSIKETIIKIEKATDYDTANKELKSDDWLARAYAFAEKLKQKRKEMGAAVFPRQPELEIKVEDGQISVSHVNRENLTASMIAEFMIWANHAAAGFCQLNKIPCLYRIQEPADVRADFSGDFDPVKFFAALKTFKKTTVSANAGLHASLGLHGYTQVTSPLRRYADLLLHRQIKSYVRTQKPCYSQNDLEQVLMLADEAIRRADEIMRDRDRYFLFKYLQLKRKNETLLLDATVVDQSMNEVYFYVDFLCGFRHCRRPRFDVAAGQKVKAKVNQIDLFDGLIRFELLPC